MDSNLPIRNVAETFTNRMYMWSEEYEKRNRGALGVSFGSANALYCASHVKVWGQSNEEYSATKSQVDTSPKPGHPTLKNMFPRNHERMTGFHHKLDIEADLKYEGLIPGTVSLQGYVAECNRFKRTIFEHLKTANPNAGPQECDTCLELCLDRELAPRMIKTSLTEIEKSIGKGCKSCELLRDGIDLCKSHFQVPKTEFHGERTHKIGDYAMLQRLGYTTGYQRYSLGKSEEVINWAYGRGCGLCLTYIFRSGPDDKIGTVVELDLFIQKGGNTPCPWKSVRESTEISGHTSSKKSFLRAVEWIEGCKKTQKGCSKSTSGVLPDRVLDLGTADFQSESPVQLYETKNETADYVSLSYCWGLAQNLMTFKRNFNAHKEGISWEVLPQTFKDAIVFTRRLNIRYLWIDSLCIVQDDDADWQKQAFKMPEIYENSYVTIAATASDSSTGGCFRKADQKYMAQEMSIEDRNGTPHQIFARQHLPHWISADSRYPATSFEDFPIWHRGWIMQERLLAPRVIHFGRHELMWECTEAARCECSFLDHIKDDGKLDKILHYRNIAFSEEEKLANQAVRLAVHEASPPQRWRALVAKYSRLNLTYGKDIFPALAGLAKQWNRTIGDEYLAGLWKGNLPIDLLWHVKTPKRQELDKWRAPSWSWASGKYAVDWVDGLNNEGEPEIHLSVFINASRILVGEDPFGQISYASLTVYGLLCPGKLVIFSPAEKPDAHLLIERQWINTLPDPSAELFFIQTELFLDQIMDPTCECRGRLDTSAPMAAWNVVCMRIATISSIDYSLVLSFDQEKETYIRLGVLSDYVGSASERKKGRVPWESPNCYMQVITIV